jgi:hypothetical protein
VKDKVCPRCKQFIIGYPALSRKDNKTEICSKCGAIEALEVFITARKEVRKNGKDNKSTN